ncbi:hypothetical protein [Shewanella sp. NIFS-20-20]|uniref:hypothetical protein n=1 Tax=Shewanella sp. NIFS-20-20 TaxID=2853806 RepID=UPI001C4682C8|nr:hypothetical protein [Shewanella sp. NIFS-20-20]MBV7317362.1 hypothetical protein [Shewanella sp. NIFS-20-20]
MIFFNQSKKQLLALTFSTVLVSGCGGGDDSSDNNDGSNIADSVVQQLVKETQSRIFQNVTQKEVFYVRHDENGNEHIEHTDSRRCQGNMVCMEHSNAAHQQFDPQHEDNLAALNLSKDDVRITRFRNANEVNNPDSDLLPVYINENKHLTPQREQMIRDALKQIEHIAGQQIFQTEIRYSQITQYDALFEAEYAYVGSELSNLWDGFISGQGVPATEAQVGDSYKKLIARDGVNGGLILAWGTVFRSSCEGSLANASSIPLVMGQPSYFIDNEGYLTNESFNWVNLGQAHSQCTNMDKISHDVIVHEIAHAIGLSEHFTHFGNHGVFGGNAKAVLSSLYNNPVNSLYSEITNSK